MAKFLLLSAGCTIGFLIAEVIKYFLEQWLDERKYKKMFRVQDLRKK